MYGMGHLKYWHEPLRPLMRDVISLSAWAARALLKRVASYVPWLSRHRTVWAVLALVLGLMIQMVLLWLLGEMISLCISLAELWTELAVAHYAITS